MKEDKNNNIMGPKSILNIEAQKELINHTIKVSTNNALKMFFIVFPTVLLTIFALIFGIFYLTGVIR